MWSIYHHDGGRFSIIYSSHLTYFGSLVSLEACFCNEMYVVPAVFQSFIRTWTGTWSNYVGPPTLETKGNIRQYLRIECSVQIPPGLRTVRLCPFMSVRPFSSFVTGCPMLHMVVHRYRKFDDSNVMASESAEMEAILLHGANMNFFFTALSNTRVLILGCQWARKLRFRPSSCRLQIRHLPQYHRPLPPVTLVQSWIRPFWSPSWWCLVSLPLF